MTGCAGSDGEIILRASALAPIVVMKIGKGGCIVRQGGRMIQIPGETVAIEDATGAGDAFAAGFLYGLIVGADLEACGTLGNRLASRIVTIEGCRYDKLNREEILEVLEL